MALSANKLNKLAHRRVEVMLELAQLNKEKAAIDLELETLEPGKPYKAGDLRVVRTAVNMLDAPTIAEAFPASKRPEFYKLALDTAEFKKHFSAVELAAYQKPSYRITIKEID